MTKRMPIVADIPTEDPRLGFPEYVDALADAIRWGEPAQFTIGLYGAWGSGKSSLLKAIAKTLSQSSSDVLPVIFDAWRHERAEHIIVPMLHGIEEAARRSGDRALTQHLRRALQALIFSLNFSVSGIGIDTRAVKDNWKESETTPLDEAFTRPFEELRLLPETLQGKRVAVLIDDLDRCSPDKVVSLLEAINLVMDVEGFVFVLALDYDVLVKAVAIKYPHVSGHEFIEKMVQLPFRVPPLVVDAEGFLGELIPRWVKREAELPEGLTATITDIADLGLRSNPRQIKRLINSFLVLERIVDRRNLDIDRTLMAAMIGLQLRWPDDFQDLQDAVLGADADPFKALLGSEEDMLVRYTKRFFAGNPGNHDLREMLQLTAVVATKAQTGADKRPVSEIRAQMRNEFVELLPQKGFAQSPRSDRLWYRRDLPDFRIALTKIGIRFEQRNKSDTGRPWDLLISMDYRSYESGLDWLDSELRS